MIAAAALAVLSGCKQQTGEEALAEFKANLETWTTEYRDAMKQIASDEALDADQKAAKRDEAFENVGEKITAAGLKLLKKFPADTLVAPDVFRQVYTFLDDEQISEVLDSFSEPVKADPFIASQVGYNTARKATAVGKKFTDFTVDHVASVDKDGNPVYEKKSLSDFVGKGKVMLVDFWSPWCPPCKEEIPNIKAVWEKYHGEDFDVLSVAVWEESRKMDWHNTIDTAAFYGMKWLQLNNGHKEPATLYGIDGIPHMVLFDKDGTILKRGDDLRGGNMMVAVSEVLGR
jgi:thiol-disulfide isomerase/thioredoxin